MQNMKRLLSLIAQLCLVVSVVVCSIACSDKGEEVKPSKGFEIVGGTVNEKDGSAILSCDGRAQTITLVFNVDDNYSISIGNCDWMSIVPGDESGVAGTSRKLRLKLSDNVSDMSRGALVYITIGNNPSCKLASVTQAISKMDAILKWMDERLTNEYYWLDRYRELKQSGDINYSLTESEFLNDALTGKKWGSINKADGYVGADGKWHLFSYIRKYAASSRAASDVEPTFGFGIELCWTVVSFSDGYGFLIDHVYPSSPAAIAGLQRGDVIKRVNGQSITANNYETLFYSIQTPSAKSISIGRESLSVEGKTEIINFELAASYYHQTPVAFCDMLQENVENGFVFGDKKIGYISYMSFDSDYDDELISGLAKLEQAGATDVIIDLRNNGGGSVMSSSYFASMLLPESYAGKEMVELHRHEKNENGSSSVKFVSEVEIDERTLTLPHLDLNSVYFLTSGDTASASEMLIMGLRAQGIDAKTIGKRSMGKDCGMDVMVASVGSTYYEFAPITFMNVFKGYDVDFGDGIVADVDFDILMQQTSDEMLKEALDWYPLPEVGAAWGNYTVDIALGEAVANILGGTIFEVSSPQGKAFAAPATRAVGSQKMGKFKTIESERVAGMYLWEHEREQLRNLNK